MRDVNEAQLGRVLDAVYDAAVSPGGWRPALDGLSLLFNSHFADLFARTHDWSAFRGCAIGLDRADYDDTFLGVWCKRNVWSAAKPVRTAGEVIATWQMVDKGTMLRSDMYSEYLRPRQLNEGLRMSLWADAGWIQDISLLRPWSAGPFSPGELALGRQILPHLQRAASVSRRLGQAGGLARLDALDRPGLLLDEAGRIIRINQPAEDLLRLAEGLVARAGAVAASAAADQPALAVAIAGAAGARNAAPLAASLTLSAAKLRLDIVPVREQSCWSLPGPRAVLVIGTRWSAPQRLAVPELMARFTLTPAEAAFAGELLSGRSLAQIAARTGRSIHTIRSHNARLLAKTGARRQADAVRLLNGLASDHEAVRHADAPVLRMVERG